MKHAPTALLISALALAWWFWPSADAVLHPHPPVLQDPAALLRQEPAAAGGAAQASPAASAASEARS